MMKRAFVLVAGLCILSAARIAAAQNPPPPPDGTRGPMVVERVHSGLAIMPEAKLTEIDGRSGTLAGASGGG